MKEFIKYEDLQNEISRLADDVDRYVNLGYDKESMLMALQMVLCWAQEESVESESESVVKGRQSRLAKPLTKAKRKP